MPHSLTTIYSSSPCSEGSKDCNKTSNFADPDHLQHMGDRPHNCFNGTVKCTPRKAVKSQQYNCRPGKYKVLFSPLIKHAIIFFYSYHINFKVSIVPLVFLCFVSIVTLITSSLKMLRIVACYRF